MKKYIVAAGSSVLILLVVLLIIIITEDKTGPIITFSDTSIVYTEGEEVEALLSYATARDSIDGDVTDSLVVASVVPLLDQPKAKVTFAAKDSNNNITKKELIVEYYESGTKVDRSLKTSLEDGMGDGSVDRVKSDNPLRQDEIKEVVGNGGILELNNGNGVNGHTSNSLAPGEEAIPNEMNEDETEDSEENEDSQESNTTNQEIADEGDINLAQEDENSSEEMEEAAVITYPRITLTTNEVKLSRGSEFNALSYVASCEDDKNSSNTLWGRIRVVGTFNMDKRGNYIMMYYTTDLDGNQSNREYLWIEVN